MEKKKCRTCGEEKVYTAFTKNYNYIGGYTTECKVCTNLRNKKIYWSTSLGISPLEFYDGEHKEEAENVLRNLGYTLYDPENTVYSQFKERCRKRGVDVSNW